jgi:hypothetical protein
MSETIPSPSTQRLARIGVALSGLLLGLMLALCLLAWVTDEDLFGQPAIPYLFLLIALGWCWVKATMDARAGAGGGNTSTRKARRMAAAALRLFAGAVLAAAGIYIVMPAAPAAWVATTAVIESALPAQEKMRARFYSGTPLARIGEGMAIAPNPRLTRAGVGNDGVITLQSEALQVNVVLTPRVVSAAATEPGAAAGARRLDWVCTGTPEKRLPPHCRQANGESAAAP